MEGGGDQAVRVHTHGTSCRKISWRERTARIRAA